MKKTLNQPILAPRSNFSSLLERIFTGHKPTGKDFSESISSLSSQRCAGFIAGPPESKKQDY